MRIIIQFETEIGIGDNKDIDIAIDKTDICIADNEDIHIKTEPPILDSPTLPRISHNKKYQIKSYPSLPHNKKDEKKYKKRKKKFEFTIMNAKRKSNSKYASLPRISHKKHKKLQKKIIPKKRENKNKKSLFYEKSSTSNGKRKNKKSQNQKIIHINKITSHLSVPLKGMQIEELKNKINKMESNIVIQCPWCEFKGEKWAYKYHLIVHTHELNFKCDLCGKKMKRQSSVNLHKQRNERGDTNCRVIKERNEKRLKQQGI